MDREQEFMALVERYKRVAYKVCSIYAPDAGQVEDYCMEAEPRPESSMRSRQENVLLNIIHVFPNRI